MRGSGRGHAAWFTGLAEDADAEIRGPGEAEAVAWLEADLANLRAAHRWATERHDADVALRLAAALWVFGFYRLQPVAWGAAALGATNRGELARARSLAERALAASSDPTAPGLFPAQYALGAAALYEGRLAESCHHHEQARACARRDGDAYAGVLAQVHGVFPIIYDAQRSDAVDAAVAARAAADTLGSPRLQGWARYAHAEALGDHDPQQARQLIDQALALADPVHDRLLQGVARVATTTLAARHESPRAALTSFADVIRHWRRAGVWTHQWTTLRNLLCVLVRLGADEPAARLYGAQRAADTAPPAFGPDAERLADARASLASRLGAALDALVEEGEQLSDTEAVDLALTAITELLDAPRVPHTTT